MGSACRQLEGYQARTAKSALDQKVPPELTVSFTAEAADLAPLLGPAWPERTKSVVAAMEKGFAGFGLIMVIARHFVWSIERRLRRLGVKPVLLGELAARTGKAEPESDR